MRCPYCNEPSMLHAEINLCVCAGCKLTAPRAVFDVLGRRHDALFAALKRTAELEAENARWVSRVKVLEERADRAHAALRGGAW